MDELLPLLQIRYWSPSCLRTNIAKPEDCVKRGTVKVANVQSDTLRKGKERHLLRLIQQLAPEWWGDETKVILNKNVTCQPHKDSNQGHSWILFLGDYAGGELCFDDGSIVSERGMWHKIDGRITHWNLPHTGDKYSIVLFRRSGASSASLIAERIRLKKAREAQPTSL